MAYKPSTQQIEAQMQITKAFNDGEFRFVGTSWNAAYINQVILNMQAKKGMFKNCTFKVSRNAIKEIITITCVQHKEAILPDEPYWQKPIPVDKKGNVNFDELFKELDHSSSSVDASPLLLKIYKTNSTGSLRY